MADWSQGREVTTRQVYTVRLPTNAVQLSQMLDAAWRAFREEHGLREPHDDSIEVTGDGEELKLSFLVQEGTGG